MKNHNKRINLKTVYNKMFQMRINISTLILLAQNIQALVVIILKKLMSNKEYFFHFKSILTRMKNRLLIFL
jgi:hypothetical protein